MHPSNFSASSMPWISRLRHRAGRGSSRPASRRCVTWPQVVAPGGVVYDHDSRRPPRIVNPTWVLFRSFDARAEAPTEQRAGRAPQRGRRAGGIIRSAVLESGSGSPQDDTQSPESTSVSPTHQQPCSGLPVSSAYQQLRWLHEHDERYLCFACRPAECSGPSQTTRRGTRPCIPPARLACAASQGDHGSDGRVVHNMCCADESTAMNTWPALCRFRHTLPRPCAAVRPACQSAGCAPAWARRRRRRPRAARARIAGRSAPCRTVRASPSTRRGPWSAQRRPRLSSCSRARGARCWARSPSPAGSTGSRNSLGATRRLSRGPRGAAGTGPLRRGATRLRRGPPSAPRCGAGSCAGAGDTGVSPARVGCCRRPLPRPRQRES